MSQYPATDHSTFFSEGSRSENLPNRTWKGEHAKSPFSCSTTITSIAPDNVACISPSAWILGIILD